MPGTTQTGALAEIQRLQREIYSLEYAVDAQTKRAESSERVVGQFQRDLQEALAINQSYTALPLAVQTTSLKNKTVQAIQIIKAI